MSRLIGVEALVENILVNFKNKFLSSATFIDLTKALDSVPHNIVISKLSCYGVRNNKL